MLAKTHLVIALALVLLFLPHINNKLIFVPVALIASLIPDIDTMYSTMGHHKLFRPFQLFVNHRGMIHSLTICVLISLAFAFYFPILALPFFLGYSSHLVADGSTEEGVKMFWPFKETTSGKIRTGGVFEEGIYYSFILVSIVLFIALFW